MNSKNFEEHIYYILDNFTKSGTPLPSLDAEELVDAAINYVNIIQERLGYYQNAKVNTLEGLLDKN